MDQSACFYPGILALADMHGVGTRSDHVLEEDDVLMGLSVLDQLEIAEELMATCMAMIDRTATGLAPERVSFRNTGNATWLQVTLTFVKVSKTMTVFCKGQRY